MSKFQVYSKSGVAKFVVGGIELHDEWMGMEAVTVTLTSAEPMSIDIGDYLIYRGLTYTIYNVPGALKCARKYSYGDAFKYENVRFEARSTELTEVRMLDYVLSDGEEPNSNTLHYSSLPDFSFYCETIDDLADRLQANTQRWCTLNGLGPADCWLWLTPSWVRTQQRCLGDATLIARARTLWEDVYDTEDREQPLDGGKVNQNVSVSNQSVWEVCSQIKDVFELNFTMRDRVCYIGAPGFSVGPVFKYGKGNGLYEIERVADEDQQVVTKLYAYGSDKNMPIRYYANLNVACYGNATSLVHYICETNISWRSSLFTTPMSEIIGHEVETESYYVKIRFRSHGTDYEGFVAAYERNDVVALAFNDAFPEDSIELMTQIWFESGIDVDKWPDNRKEYTTDNLPNNMALNVLMLPGFPNQSLYDWVLANGGEAIESRPNENVGLATWHGYTAWFSKDELQPYILSENYTTLGIKEGVKKFDGSDDTDEIYPTIEGMTNGQGLPVDQIFTAETIKDNGVYGEGDTTPKAFTITLPSFGSDFDLKELFATGESVTISMKDGYCGGREFDVKSVAAQNNGGTVIWKCTCDRDHDELLDLYFPYSYSMSIGGSAEDVPVNEPYQVRAGDKYVLTGIKMTDTYVQAASVRLLEVALSFLSANDYTRFTYLPKVDEIFMARERDEASANNTESIHDKLKAGMLMLFEDLDLNIDGSVYIDTLTIKEDGNNGIPTYEVTLRNDKQVGSIQRIENKIDSITSSGGVGMGASIPAIRQLIESYGREYFISRLNDDTARGVINFLEWLRVQNVPLPDWFVSAVDNDNVAGLLTFNQGLQSTGFESGLQGSGFSLKVMPSGATRLEVDDLLIRHLLEASEIDIHKKSYTSGYQSFGNASGKVYRVEPITDVNEIVTGYKLWFVRNDDSESVKNDWRVGDMAACETFNLVKVESGTETYRNHRWWRLVTETGVGYIDSEECNYIVVSNEYRLVTITTDNNVSVQAWGKSSANDSTPAIGDDVVQQGNVVDESRQNLYVIAVNNADVHNEAGHWIYKNIGEDTTSAATQYNLSDHVWSKETTHEVILRADRFYLTTDTGDEELKTTTRYFLKLSPQVINTSTFDGQYVVATAWKQNGTDAPAQLTSSDGFAIYVNDASGSGMVGVDRVSTNGTLSFQWRSTHVYSDIILYDRDPRYITIDGGEPVEYDRMSLSYVSDGAQGNPGADGTSFTVKGAVSGYFADIEDVPSGYYSDGEQILVDSNPIGDYALLTLDNGQWVDTTPIVGDAYKQTNDEQAGYNHIFCANGTRWVDLGQISGEDGEDGKDAGILRADITTIVIEEEKTRNGNSYTVSYPDLPRTITVSGMVGNNSLPSSSIVIGNVGVNGVVTGVTVSANIVTLNSNNILSSGREGYIDIPCSTTYDGITYQDTIRVNVYVNRLGTWKMEVENETMQMISESIGYGTDGEVLRRNTVIAQDSYQVGLSAWLNGVMRSAIKVKTNGEIEVIADLINAIGAQLVAKSLVSDNSNGLRVEIENGLLVVKYNNVIRIALGLVDNNPVLTFYDALGVKLYDLGPEGIKWMAVQEAHLVLWNIRGFVNYGPNGGIRQAPDGFLHNAMLEYVPYIVEDREDVIDGFVPFGSAIYKVYLKEWNGIFEYNHAPYPYTYYETGGTDTMEIREGDDTPSPEYNQRWMTSPVIFPSSASNLFNAQAVVIGSAWIEYIGSTAPVDYYEADYPSAYRISDWSSVEYKRIAIFQDGELLADKKVYRNNA